MAVDSMAVNGCDKKGAPGKPGGGVAYMKEEKEEEEEEEEEKEEEEEGEKEQFVCSHLTVSEFFLSLKAVPPKFLMGHNS